jgi:sterol desaturase/sphingolipid hydroxylase (fatty acid hydroxylase superfamily)
MEATAQAEADWHLRALVRYGLYPLSWAIVLFAFHMIWTSGIEPRRIWGAAAGFLAALYLLVEWLVPYEQRWAMSWRSFLADFRFALINTLFVAGLSAGLALLAIGISGDLVGPARHWPPLAQLVSCLLIFEAVNYSLHRAMHEAKGKTGKLLWSVHAAHHLPPRLYLVMHAVFHPLNGILIQGLAIILPIWLMGYDQKIVTMFLIINGMHGLISHFNVDVRMGWLNYIFVGPELHRYHHSARVDEAKNYGATLSVFDWMFGTFVYHPGTAPRDLGIDPASGLPPYERTWDVLKLPMKAL